MNYLMLDSNDITKVCGIIPRKDILKEITLQDLKGILEYPKKNLFRGRYVLVEEEFKDFYDKFEDVKIAESPRGIYYASRKGEVYIIYNKSKTKKVMAKTKHPCKNYVVVKIRHTNYALKNLIAKAFIEGTETDDIVSQKNGNIYDCSVDNLVVTKRSVHNGKLGEVANAKPVGLFENGKMVKQWTSLRKCAKDMYVSSVCIADYCNGKVKKPMFDVRWI